VRGNIIVRNLLISRKVDMPVLKQTNVTIRVFLYFSKDAPHINRAEELRE